MAGTTARMHDKPATATALVVATNTPFWVQGDTATPVKVFIPGSGRLKGKVFRVVASGRITGAITTNATIRLQFGTSATGASNTTVEASSARAVNSTTRPFMITIEGVIDNVTDVVNGRGWSQIGATLDAVATLDANPTIDPDTEGQAFVCSVEFSADSALNAAFLDSFFLEVLE